MPPALCSRQRSLSFCFHSNCMHHRCRQSKVSVNTGTLVQVSEGSGFSQAFHFGTKFFVLFFCLLTSLFVCLFRLLARHGRLCLPSSLCYLARVSSPDSMNLKKFSACSHAHFHPKKYNIRLRHFRSEIRSFPSTIPKAVSRACNNTIFNCTFPRS